MAPFSTHSDSTDCDPADPDQVATDRNVAPAAELLGPDWSSDSIGDLVGRRFLITGGTRGLGNVVARKLAAQGARVTITGRQWDAVFAAAAAIPGAFPVQGIALDLADLASVREAVLLLKAPVDVLINNAGVLWGPYRKTAQGVEYQIGVNFVGHFALTGLLMPRLLAGNDPRLVTLTSNYAKRGSLNPRDLHPRPRNYASTRAYAVSKLANLAFGLELARRAEAVGSPLTSVIAHPGYARTELMTANLPHWQRGIVRRAGELLAMPVEQGAESMLCAAVVPGLPRGTYLGPCKLGGFRGRPGVLEPPAAALDRAAVDVMWRWATEVSGVTVSVDRGWPSNETPM